MAQNKSKVFYEYGLPNNYKRIVKFDFTWHFTGEWSSCNKSCGKGFILKYLKYLNKSSDIFQIIKGFRTMRAKCLETKLGTVDDSFCKSKFKPRDKIEPCNVFECPAEFV